jgi:hypothetical protein
VRKGRTFGQSTGDKSVVLLETYWGTHWELGEPLGNFMETPHCKKKKTKACMESQLPTVQVKSKQWTVHSSHQTQLENKNLAPSKNKKGGNLRLHDTTSHWLHGNSIHKIGCHNNTLPIIN